MKSLLRGLFLFFVFCFATSVLAIQPVKVEVLFMNHGPLRATINNMQTLFAKYENKVSVKWYDFDSPEGVKFMKSKGVTDHTPLVIWIDGKSTQNIDGKEVNFKGFPSDTGPAAFRGSWNLDMLNKVLDQSTQ